MKLLDIIPNQPSWSVMDQSKLTTFMRCPRKYFYRYILGWQSTFPNNHLVFGTAWHAALEHLMLNSYAQKALIESQFIFNEIYRQSFTSETDDLYEPKTPKNAFRSLNEYSRKYGRELEDNSLLHTEIGGYCYIDGLPLHFRLDAIVQNNRTNKVRIIDQKTSQRRLSNWQDIYTQSMQMILYLYAGYCIYGDRLSDVTIRCSFFYKSKPTEFEETRVEKSIDQLREWIQYTTFHYENLLKETNLLFEQDDSIQTIMYSFPKNTTACHDFGRACEYISICPIWNNPLQHATTPPVSMEVSHWNPSNDPLVRERVDLKLADANNE